MLSCAAVGNQVGKRRSHLYFVNIGSLGETAHLVESENDEASPFATAVGNIANLAWLCKRTKPCDEAPKLALLGKKQYDADPQIEASRRTPQRCRLSACRTIRTWRREPKS
jgi:hypothetical protein